MRRLSIGDVDLLLTKSQFKTLRELTGGAAIDTDGLQALLSSLPAPLADRIEEAITVAEAQVGSTETEIETVAAAVDKTMLRKKRAAKRAAAEAREEEAAAQEEEATPEPTPSPDGQNEESGSSGEEEEGGDAGQSTEEEEGDGGLPGPLKP